MQIDVESNLIQMINDAQFEALKEENVKKEKLGRKIEVGRRKQELMTIRR